ncbi:hypothetical protein N7486_010869 [Penicillium sp. IBT 16267x]|nr:hypothetical protein N7486_010869 [Penicillium sp. IBT 16267x]
MHCYSVRTPSGFLAKRKNCEGKFSKLERYFTEKVHNSKLQPLLEMIKELMRFLPSSRITADEALGLLEDSQEGLDSD